MRFPGFIGTMEALRLLLAPLASVALSVSFLRPRFSGSLRRVAPRGHRLLAGLVRVTAGPTRELGPRRRRRDLPGSCTALACVPRSQTPVGIERRPFRALCVAFRLADDVGPTLCSFVALSRSPHAPCVRFNRPVARDSATLGSGWWSALAGWTLPPQGCFEDFTCLRHVSLLPGLPGAPAVSFGLRLGNEGLPRSEGVEKVYRLRP